MKISTLRKTIVLLILMIAVSVPAFALAGAGTSSNPYQVATVADLEAVAQNPSAYYKQVADIVINDANLFEYNDGVIVSAKSGAKEWIPFDFSGTYDGNNKYITGLFVSSDSAYGGLFKTLNGATVKNLNVDFALVESDECAGILASSTTGTASISNVLVSGSVIGKTTKSMNTAGGIVGRLGKNGTLNNSVSYATVSGATSYSANIGGVAGINDGDIDSCTFGGKAFGTATYYDASIGGIAGYNTGDIYESRNQGTVGGESTALVNDCYVGGIVGTNKGYIEYATNHAKVSGKNFSSGNSICGVGGIAGITVDGSISCGTNNGEVLGEKSYCGGIVGVAIADTGTTYVDYNDNTGAVTSSYGVAGGIVGRAVSAGEGYVSTKLDVSGYNSGNISGNAKGDCCGETYTLESAQLISTLQSYSNDNTSSAYRTTSIIADEYQYGDALTHSLSESTGTASVVTTADNSKHIIRYTVSGRYFKPAPVLVTLSKVSSSTEVEIVSVDVSNLTISGEKLTGSISVRVYTPDESTVATAVVGISVGNKFVATKFAPVDASDARIDVITIPVDATVESEGTITVNTLVVGNTDKMDPLCENVIVTK